MSDQRPNKFTVRYHGHPITFKRITQEHGDSGGEGTTVGYGYRCPIEEKAPHCWIDTESGTRHKLEFDADGLPTITGSLVHRATGGGCNCGWHVIVTKGVAEDA